MRSVLAQDYTPLEYLVIDGASTDGSLEIIRCYADRLSWWVSEPDRGQAEAINKGLERSNGEIVAWLNSDDLYLPGAITQAVSALQQNPDAGLVFGDALTIDAQGRLLNRLTFGDWGLEELVSFRIICQPTVFMRRSVLEQTDFLDSSYHFLLDHHLWVRLARLAPIYYASKDLQGKPGGSSARLNGLWAAARHHPAAKNVARAGEFGQEAFRLLAWMRNQPDLEDWITTHKKRVYGGVYRLNARYLLDGGLPGAALKSYFYALLTRPAYALQHWHRMLYALACLVGLGGAAQRAYLRLVDKRPDLTTLPNLAGWPGILLEQGGR